MKTRRNLIPIGLLCAAVLQALTSGAQPVTKIAAGQGHSLFLKSDGSLWAMGWNNEGELGDGTYNQTNRPEQIVVSGVTAIAAENNHNLFLKSNGSLWAMGWNDFGQLGDGTYNNTNRPEQIVASNVMAIAVGGLYSLLLKSDGSLWGMGSGSFGQLGNAVHSMTNRPQQIVASNVAAIAAGSNHSLFLKNNGSLWALGLNMYGELGDGTTSNANQPEQIVVNLGYDEITGQLLGGTNMQLSFWGIARAKYALDRSSSLSAPNWVPQATNPGGASGVVVFTNPPDAATNNFWRIRSVP